jgi:hypothetical protein
MAASLQPSAQQQIAKPFVVNVPPCPITFRNMASSINMKRLIVQSVVLTNHIKTLATIVIMTT